MSPRLYCIEVLFNTLPDLQYRRSVRNQAWSHHWFFSVTPRLQQCHTGRSARISTGQIAVGDECRYTTRSLGNQGIGKGKDVNLYSASTCLRH